MIPRSLQLPRTIPDGVEAARRRFVAPATNITVAGPSDTIQIPIPSATDQTMMDNETLFLRADITIYNGVYSVDYANFGVEGVWGSLIQDWKVVNQGQPIEAIYDYPSAATLLTNLQGDVTEDVTMYMSSKLCVGYAEEYHKNFIKPPMVSGDKNIMFGVNHFGLGIDTSYARSTQYFNSMQSAEIKECNQIFFNMGMSNLSQYNNDTENWAITNYTGFGSSTTGASGAGTSPSWAAPSSLPAAYLATGVSAMDWPDFFDPNEVEIVDMYVKEFGSVNKPQVVYNLANVKCFPIGMIPKKDSYSGTSNAYGARDGAVNAVESSWANDGVNYVNTASVPTASNPTYRIMYRPWSSFLGRLARKMILTSFIAPQQLYIEIKLAEPHLVFQLSSDPCRVITGTVRSFVRNLGTKNGAGYGSGTWTKTDITSVKVGANPYVFTESDLAVGYNSLSNIITSNAKNSLYSSGSAYGVGNVGKAITNDENGTQVNMPYVLPTPQYALAKEPWKFRGYGATSSRPIVTYAVDTEMFYGTYLKASVPQCRRIFDLNYDGTVNASKTPPVGTDASGNTGITYRLRNIALVGDLLSFDDAVYKEIYDVAAAGNFNVHALGVRTAALTVQSVTDQHIQLNGVRAVSGHKIFVIFQDQAQRAVNTAWYYDSNCGINIFSSVDIGANNQYVSVPVSATGDEASGKSGLGVDTVLYGVGLKNAPVYTPTPCDNSGGISVQLQIGNTNYPEQELTSMQELLQSLQQTMGVFTDRTYNPNFSSRVVPLYNSSTKTSKLVYDGMQPGRYATTFVPYELLDDQTIVCNYDWVPLYSYRTGGASDSAGEIAHSNATRNSAVNGYNYLCPRGFCTRHFVPPPSTFCLGFDMETWLASAGVNSGLFLGNLIMTLKLRGAVGLNTYELNGQKRQFRGLAVTMQEIVYSYGQGGQILSVT